MNIQVAVLCDAATDDQGKLNILGAFDTINALTLPAIHPQCAIALRVTFTSGTVGTLNYTVNGAPVAKAIRPTGNWLSAS